MTNGEVSGPGEVSNLVGDSDPFQTARAVFESARAMRDAGDKDRALTLFLSRAGMGCDLDEVYAALCEAAELMAALDHPPEQVLATWERAIAQAPHRAEGFHGASLYCRSRGRNEDGFQFARRALALVDSPPPAERFVRDWIYEFGLLDEYAVNGYWAGHYRECLDASLKILAHPKCPEGQRRRFLDNARFAAEKVAEPPRREERRYIRLKEFAPSTTRHNTPPDWYIASRSATLHQRLYEITTDRDGFIVSSPRAEGRDGRLVVLGDSVVEGMFLDPGARICSVLQGLLRAEMNLDISVLNAGYGGATSLHSFNTFLNKIIPLQPTAVLLMSGIVDVDAARKRASFWSRDCWLEPIVDLSKANEWRDPDVIDPPDLTDRDKMLRLFAEASRLFDLPLWLATIPHLQVFGGEVTDKMGMNRADFDAEVTSRLRMNDVTRRVGTALSIPVYDIEKDLSTRADIFHDMFHLNVDGGLAVARAFMDRGLGHALERVTTASATLRR